MRHRVRALVFPAVAAALLVGCGGASTPVQVVAPAAVDHGRGSSNEQQAQHEAARLLSLTHVPPGAQKLSVAPRDLQAPAMGRPSVDSLVDRAAYWQVSMSFDATLSWLRAHPPAGLQRSGSTSGGGPGFRAAGDDYSEPDRGGLTDQQLAIGISSRGAGATDIRADGMVVWLDATPMRDTASGPRLRLEVANGCPRSDAKAVGVSNRGGDLAHALLPAPHPTAALICTYAGSNGRPPMGLLRSTRLAEPAASRLAGAVRAMSLSHPDGVVTSCPMDDGSATVLAFSYRGRPDVDLWWSRTGCSSVSNGVIAVSGSVPGLPSAPRGQRVTPATSASAAP